MPDQASPLPHSVCVVIPMYNSADSIEQTLASLAGQTRLPDHVIVIDDGSTDDGPQRVKDFAAPFRLTLLHQANEGQASARNHGLRHTEETFVAFLDADDTWYPQKLEQQLALYDELNRQGRPVGLIDCYVLNDYGDGRRQVEKRRKNGWHFYDFIHANVVNGVSSVLARRDVIMQLGGFDASLRYSEDRFMWARVAEHWEIHTVPQVLLQRRVNSGNITSQPTKYYPQKIRFIEVYLARYGEQLSKQQRIDFVLGNHTDFLNLFSRRAEHAQVIGVYRRMLEYSWQTLIFANGKPTLRYLYACARSLRKTTASTTAH
ncbi:glycosyltransferase family 2 protein [Pseudomonas frederiksbergensis]|uniref:Glycosyltransferase family 2 protein n=1 Tax=Pseudomonas frederiksbergensis TaxID=104087 RepID=A0A2S8HGM6_9PSED|nr:glycosyltransferase family 2 protein [Pseudomonas frederiksbergensis]PQP01659.1 glycosyltransferase family 2 protein [Pseudomonas frederiksbergensis]